jgi:hypothetical protein
MRLLGALAIIVPILVGATTLAFSWKPGLKPCLGDTDASFTGAPVFPHVGFRDHLIREGTPREEAAKEDNIPGAEVRFSYTTNGFRGKRLVITWSLVRVERDGTLGAVVRGEDRALARVVTPDSCSEAGGKDLFVPILTPGKRYRVVLEMYRSASFDDRLALTETDVFRG